MKLPVPSWRSAVPYIAIVIGVVALATAAAALLVGCAQPQRSRDLANPTVPAPVIAQQVCANCHGVHGNPVSPNFPTLAGQPQAYLVAQLKALRAQRRRDPAAVAYMWGLTRSLTDAQIDGLAAYYAGQTARPAAAAPPRDADLRAGQALYENGRPAAGVIACAACHGAHGEGNGAVPRLAGQAPPYVLRQLRVFGHDPGQRPDGAAMQAEARPLSALEMRDLAAWVQAMDGEDRAGAAPQIRAAPAGHRLRRIIGPWL